MNNNKGFTLIEIIISTALIAIVLPIVASMLFSVFRQQIMVSKMSEVKRQGDLALSRITTLVNNNASQLWDTSSQVCSGNAGPVTSISTFRDASGTNAFGLSITSGVLLVSPTYSANLTNDKVTVSDLFVQCRKISDFSKPLVNVKYKVTYNAPASSIDTNPSLDYSTFILIRK